MSTRSVIGILNEDKTVNSVYCHFDGYPEHTGYFLKKFFDTTEKVNNLISNGDYILLAAFGSGFTWGSILIKWDTMV